MSVASQTSLVDMLLWLGVVRRWESPHGSYDRYSRAILIVINREEVWCERHRWLIFD